MLIMPGRKSKTKGRSFEQEVAKLFTDWAGSKFRRVPLSGGWQSSGVVTGDIFLVAEYEVASISDAPRVRFPFSVECKKQEGWDFAQLFRDSEKCPLRLFWVQAASDADKIKKLPVMIFSRNYLPIFIMIGTKTVNRLARLTNGPWHDLNHIIVHMSKRGQVVIFLLEDFFQWIPFEILLKLTV
jgi:hypothetical protein